ncbi:MAG TPA: hypothetical protein VFB45_06835 [Pseudolabrys sp.]|nr:hypothetical protein [Pseudolabrys sp.]
MRSPLIRLLGVTAVAGLVLALNPVLAQAAGEHGEVVLSNHGTVSQKQTPPPLSLSDQQRHEISKVIDLHGISVSFALKATKSAKDFSPSVGAKIPNGLKPHSLPQPLITEIPALKSYGYLKFKDQVLIIDPMKRTIVDMFPVENG